MLFDKKSYFIREHVGMLKLSDTYDILDPESQEQLAIAKEKPGGLIHVLRFFINKQMLPTQVDIHPGADFKTTLPVLTIKRGFTLFRSKVDVLDGDGRSLGFFKSKLFSFGGAFRVFDENGLEVALVKGDWKGWNFRFLVQDQEIGMISKKWAGIGKELFTSADNYIVNINGNVSPEIMKLLVAASIAVDTVYKEKG